MQDNMLMIRFFPNIERDGNQFQMLTQIKRMSRCIFWQVAINTFGSKPHYFALSPLATAAKQAPSKAFEGPEN